jgi:hypothetical protein
LDFGPKNNPLKSAEKTRIIIQADFTTSCQFSADRLQCKQYEQDGGNQPCFWDDFSGNRTLLLVNLVKKERKNDRPTLVLTDLFPETSKKI